ncbi:MAG TPA: DinB family protein [Gemmatimonadales bacterium]|nr:DinB family protein [Gemmatimonadales bacterium]
MTPLDEALAGNREVLAQAADLLGRLSDADYVASGGLAGRSPIGAHLRHALDHYRSFFAGLKDGRVDYEARHRDSALEHDRLLAAEEVARLRRALEQLTGGEGNREILVNLCSMADPGAGADWSRSTLKRELQFLVSHTVHHFALIRVRLLDLGLEPEEEFGMAPSTILARRRGAAGAPDLATR